MKKKKEKKGIVFWITGLSGSGKTSIAKKIGKNIKKKYGPTLIISGDDVRKIFNYKSFSKKDRLFYALSYGKFCKLVTDKKINIIFSTVSLFHKVRKWNKLNIDNYCEIFIKSSIKEVMDKKKKFFYKGNYKNVVGKNLKAEFPKRPNIVIKNDFSRSINQLANELIKKISNDKNNNYNSWVKK